MDENIENYEVISKNERLNPIVRFRTITLKVIANLSWINDDYRLTPIDLFEFKAKETLIESYEITVFHKLMFFKLPNERTTLELESIKWMFAIGFKFFRLCPIEIQMAFIKNASYKCYGPNRWILKEGHSPQYMYLIVKGKVRITEQVYNPVSKIMETIEHCQLNEKKSFGESAVMFNTSLRITSVQSLSTVEFICISKNDFMDITANNLQQIWHVNAEAINKLSYFEHLSPMELNKCYSVSFIKTFALNEYVFGEGLGNVDCGHFVLEGKILMVYRLKVMENTNCSGNIKFKLCNEKSKNRKKYVNKYMETCIFSSGSCFNIGENMENKEFMSTKKTKCLCVPHWFLKKTEKLKNWEFIKLDLNNIIPDREKVFQRFLTNQK